MTLQSSFIEKYSALFGEFAWHSITVDPTINQVSDAHYNYILQVLNKHGQFNSLKNLSILEVASYAHTTGYRLKEEMGAKVTLFDLSAKSLELGRKVANYPSSSLNPRLIAGDFHYLPFQDNSFDVVYICSALHHTWNYDVVVREMQRVLAPGGLLVLENEPCKRACCFYMFRTNRMNQFTPFEQTLYDLGVLRIFAEPFLGSRPEDLFGMIENQTIPLPDLLNTLNSKTPIIEIILSPEICMGELEHSWVQNRHIGISSLTKLIENSLVEKYNIALESFGSMARGLGFELPKLEKLKPFASNIAQLLSELPPPSDELRFRKGLSEIFGAAVQIVARKNNEQNQQNERGNSALKENSPQKNNIYYTFGEETSHILMYQQSLLPDIQSAGKQELSNFFPSVSWSRLVQVVESATAHNSNREQHPVFVNLLSKLKKIPGLQDIIQNVMYKDEILPINQVSIVSLSLTSSSGVIILPDFRGKLLTILRLSCAGTDTGYARISIKENNEKVFVHDAWQSETVLFVHVFESYTDGTQQQIKLDIIREIVSETEKSTTVSEGISILYAGAFEM